jgi:large subunit ribosomal protein L21
MYAVIETGGKQYRVAPGDVIDVERGLAVADDGAVEFDRVLMVSGDAGIELGRPVVEGALVRASLVDEVRGPKIRVFKMKRRKGYRRTAGHRQDLLRLKIDGIETAGAAKGRKKAAKAAATKAATEAATGPAGEAEKVEE